MKKLTMKPIATVAIAAAAIAMLAGVALASSGGTKPGLGYGDKNHVHTGPPGHSVSANP
jgi:hypothetical protein